jgi:hypothetical protein
MRGNFTVSSVITKPRNTTTSTSAPDPVSVVPAGWNMDGPPSFVPPGGKGQVAGYTFRAELDLAELDDRLRPGPAWASRAELISRSHMVVLSRKMSYVGRLIAVAVHLIDSEPTPLLGRVTECEYHADGLYRIVLELLPMPKFLHLTRWFESRVS